MNDSNLDDLVRKVKILRELRRREKQNQFARLFPSEGPLRRDLYPKHLEFFRAGKEHRERLFMAANRSGKTVAGGYEATCHLTGRYPHWWEGRRFDRPVIVMCAGDTGQTTRDILQTKMLGGLYQTDEWGTGIIPGDCLDKRPHIKQGVSGAYESAPVRHVSGGYSDIKFRSYDQGRKIFQGFELDMFWADEEIPQDVYAEALIRTMTTGGMAVMTFTPLSGLTPLVINFMESMGAQEPL